MVDMPIYTIFIASIPRNMLGLTVNIHTLLTVNIHTGLTVSIHTVLTVNIHTLITVNIHTLLTVNIHTLITVNIHTLLTVNIHTGLTVNIHTVLTVNIYTLLTVNKHTLLTVNIHTNRPHVSHVTHTLSQHFLTTGVSNNQHGDERPGLSLNPFYLRDQVGHSPDCYHQIVVKGVATPTRLVS
jgi:hypothetical protein